MIFKSQVALIFLQLQLLHTFIRKPTKWDETETLLETRFFLNLEKSPSATTVNGAWSSYTTEEHPAMVRGTQKVYPSETKSVQENMYPKQPVDIRGWSPKGDTSWVPGVISLCCSETKAIKTLHRAGWEELQSKHRPQKTEAHHKLQQLPRFIIKSLTLTCCCLTRG